MWVGSLTHITTVQDPSWSGICEGLIWNGVFNTQAKYETYRGPTVGYSRGQISKLCARYHAKKWSSNNLFELTAEPTNQRQQKHRQALYKRWMPMPRLPAKFRGFTLRGPYTVRMWICYNAPVKILLGSWRRKSWNLRVKQGFSVNACMKNFRRSNQQETVPTCCSRFQRIERITLNDRGNGISLELLSGRPAQGYRAWLLSCLRSTWRLRGRCHVISAESQNLQLDTSWESATDVTAHFIAIEFAKGLTGKHTIKCAAK